MKNNVRLYNKNNFCNAGFDIKGQFEYEKALFLLSFDGDPEAQTNGLLLLKKSKHLGYQKASEEIKRIIKCNEYENARNLYRFIHGKELI